MTPGPPSRNRMGFTLIEVLGALVVFSFGVLMVLRLVGALSLQMNAAAARSMVAVTVQSRLDSLASLPYDSLPVGTMRDTILLLGQPFRRSQIVLQTTPLVREVEVTVEPTDGEGPRLTASTFLLRTW